MSNTKVCTFQSDGSFIQPIGLARNIETQQEIQEITWSFAHDSTDIEGRKLEIKALKRAFLRWASHIKVRFKYLESGGEINITFSKTDPYFQENPNAIAYAFLGDVSGFDIVFNDTWPNWRLDNQVVGANDFNIEVVALHEIGHRLKLTHNQGCQDCVMYPFYNKQLVPQENDIQRIQAFWGKRSWWERLKAYFERSLT